MDGLDHRRILVRIRDLQRSAVALVAPASGIAFPLLVPAFLAAGFLGALR
jgi:hypothetical protein